eukprot:scaffold167353_cov31-Attheya_sp.AAC.1
MSPGPFGGGEVKRELSVGAIALAISAVRAFAGELTAENEAAHVDVLATVVGEPASVIGWLVAREVTGLTAMARGLLFCVALASRSRRPWFFGAFVGGGRRREEGAKGGR